MPTVQTVTDPAYANEAGTAINCMVKFAEFPDPLPFTASENDPEEYGRELYYQLVAGVYGPVAPYVPPPVVEPVTTVPTVI
jgi:hypothetical protein